MDRGLLFILPPAMGSNLGIAQTRVGKSAERQWPRFKADFPVKLWIGSGAKPAIQGQAHDLGEGGMAVYVGVEFAEGQLIHLSFTPPFCRRPLELLAVVRDRAGYRYGFEFRSLTRDAAEDISRACRALALAVQQ